MRKLLLIGLFSAFVLTACGEDVATVSISEFEKLNNGMTYEEVKEIVGGVAKSDHVNTSNESIVEYYYDSDEGSEITLMFIDDKLDNKMGFDDELKLETTTTEPVEVKSWEDGIKEIANSSEATGDKYYALEKYMMEYQATDELDKFKDDIIADYKSGSYLSEIDNHERMLTNIFKSYIVEKNSEDDTLKDFAFDYHQNLKYTYRGVDAVDSDSVKANEEQMNKALSEIK